MADQGEGSRGGKIIGHYKSGRAKYAIGGAGVAASVGVAAASHSKIDKLEHTARIGREMLSNQPWSSHEAALKSGIESVAKKAAHFRIGRNVAAIGAVGIVAGLAASSAKTESQKATAKEIGGGLAVAGTSVAAIIAAKKFGLGKKALDVAKRVATGVKKIQGIEHSGASSAQIASNTTSFAFTGLVGGSMASGIYASSKFNSLAPKLEKDMALPDQVDAKKQIKSEKEFKNISVITNREELLANKDLTDIEKYYAIKNPKKLYGSMETFEQGKNAAAYKSKETGKEFIFSSKSVNKAVLGHELGHIRDYRAGRIDENSGGFVGTITGRQLAQEESAWSNSPYKGKKDEPIKTDALETYRTSRNATRIFGGTMIGSAVIGVVAGAFKIKLR